MCIYYSDRDDLAYTSGEHIFPAAIGGKLKLPKGYVSNQFNNDISSLEQDFIRESIISIPRQAHGPGKRGSMSISNAARSKILVIETNNPMRPFLLGYSRFQKTVEIPHFYYDAASLRGGIGLGAVNRTEAEQTIKDLKLICSNPAAIRIVTILDERLPETFYMFGIDGIGSKTWRGFFAKHPQNAFELTNTRISQLSGMEYTTENYRVEGEAQLKTIRTLKFDHSHLRIYSKIAFNFLAHLQKPEFVKHRIFDPFRNWVSKGWDGYFANWDLKGVDLFKK